MTFRSWTSSFTLHTSKRLDFITITDRVRRAVSESGVVTGIVLIQTHHTTCGVWINENEKNLIEGVHGESADIHRVMDSFAHPDDEYHHNDVRDVTNPQGKRDTHLCEPDSCGKIHECLNGHAHAQALLIQPSLSMIVRDSELLLGRWQEVMLVELDHDRERTVTIVVQGEQQQG